MTEHESQASGGFAKFLKRSAEKLSSKKGVTFLPPETKGKNGGPSGSEAKSQKEHRRAQVRKAQIEHRQRKENYIKHLEQDVIRLRDQIATVESETSVIEKENVSIQDLLSTANITLDRAPYIRFQHTLQDTGPLDSNNFQTDSADPDSFQRSEFINMAFNYSSSSVSTIFDDIIDTSRLQVSRNNSASSGSAMSKSPDTLNFNISPSPLSQPPQNTQLSGEGQQQLLPFPDQGFSSLASSPRLDTSMIAINFILALEHPCRTHFHALPHGFDPTGDPTGHELMASALLYSHAPESAFEDLNSARWTAPSLELKNLWDMSQSLPKGDFEVTPVQAWFMLTQQYEAKHVLKKLEGLKSGLGQVVACWGFGAVMDELKFWEIVNAVLGV